MVCYDYSENRDCGHQAWTESSICGAGRQRWERAGTCFRVEVSHGQALPLELSMRSIQGTLMRVAATARHQCDRYRNDGPPATDGRLMPPRLFRRPPYPFNAYLSALDHRVIRGRYRGRADLLAAVILPLRVQDLTGKVDLSGSRNRYVGSATGGARMGGIELIQSRTWRCVGRSHIRLIAGVLNGETGKCILLLKSAEELQS